MSSRRAGNIVVVLSGLTAGGSERVTSIIVNHWAAQGRSVTVVSFDSPQTKPFFEFDPRVDVRQLGLPNHPSSRVHRVWQMLRRARALRAVIREKSPDLVLSLLTKINVLSLLAARGLGVPVIVSERNNPLRQPMDPLWSMLRDLLYPKAFRLIAQTSEIVPHLPKAIQARAVVIPNPIMPEMNDQQREPTKVVAAVGRIVDQKGFDLFLRAAAKIAPSADGWNFVIWGEGVELGRLEDLCRELGLDDRVYFPGLTGSPGAWLSATSIYVLSSRYEGFPNALGEAMAAGLPVISFDCPFGPSALVTHEVDGLLVEPEDVDALASAMKRMIDDETLRRRLGAEARISVRRFAPEGVLRDWDAVADAASHHKQKDASPAAERSLYEADRT